MNSTQIKIFDTTLRDGQQCPGAGMSFDKNLEYAQLAFSAGVDILEAGFPSASKQDSLIVEQIAKMSAQQRSSPIIAALCQLRAEQIEQTMTALSFAKKNNKARLHTYLPVDPCLMVASLGKFAQQKEELIKQIYTYISLAVKENFEVQLSLEGYSRIGENFDFGTQAIRAAIAAGATIINCPDTIGGACVRDNQYFVHDMQKHAVMMKREFPNANITWSVHCHNDFGLALENTMNGIFLGPATQIEGCFNGVGERAGNVSLEQCIMYLKNFNICRETQRKFAVDFNHKYLQDISNFVSNNMLPRQPNWPITGLNSARHTSGGHTNAILKNPLVYQPFDPKTVGNELSFVFGPLSGGNHAKSIIERAGFACADHEKANIAQFIKNYYHDRRKGITDDELLQAYFEYRKTLEKECEA